MTSPDGINIDPAAAPAAAANLAEAARMVRAAWDTHRPAIEAAEAQFVNVAGEDADALRKWYLPPTQQLKDAFPKVEAALDALAAKGKEAVGAFQEQDDSAARQLRA